MGQVLDKVLSVDADPAVLDLCWRHRDQLMLASSTTEIHLRTKGKLIAKIGINAVGLETLVSLVS